MHNANTRVHCFYYGITGGVSHISAWRHFQTVSTQISVGSLRLDGEWYRRVIRTESGEMVPAIGIWNSEADITTVIVGIEFPDRDHLLREIQGTVLPDQLLAEEWQQ